MTMKKTFSLFITVLFIQCSVNARQLSDSIKTALVLVDIQNFYFPGDGPGLVNAEQASLSAKEILQVFREEHQMVIHVRHKSSKGFEFHENVEPVSNEKVITKDKVNSFLGTDLLEYLERNAIVRLVIIGMQTHMCLEAAVRAAHDYGFECIVIPEACATRDLKFGDKMVKAADVQTSVLAVISGGGYGKVVDLKSFLDATDKFLFQKMEKQ